MDNVYIIAEIGVNHNGDEQLASEMIKVAATAGVDAVKFQTGIPELVMSRYAPKAEYQVRQTGNADEGQLGMVKKLELPMEAYSRFQHLANENHVDFLSTPFDLISVDYLYRLGMDVWKIPSGEITNLPYLIKIAQLRRPIILSTGMSTMDEVDTAVSILNQHGAGRITLLHCTTEYPAPYESVNLRAMLEMQKHFQLPVGYSDHTEGIEISVAAVAMGATVIEKHFTLDKTLPGPDHRASIEVDELRSLVQSIRNIEKALGSGEKIPAPSEQKNIMIARRSLVALRSIQKGEIFTEDNIVPKRPGTGISPMLWFEVLGTSAKRNFLEDELIEI